MSETERVGEVIEASSTVFTSQCYELYGSPPLGSLVKTADGDIELYGVLFHAETTSLEPGRRPIARGKDEESEDAVYRSNPQLLELLKSEFSALVVGYRQGDGVKHYLPPQPARIHGFVYLCPPDEVQKFSSSFTFLNMLLGAGLPISTEELTSAALRQMSQAHQNRRSFLVSDGMELALLVGSNFTMLRAILERIQS
jgi:hypothetical protein